MKIQKNILAGLILVSAVLSCTEPEPVNIYGNIAGKITDESTGEAIDGVTVEISGINQTQKTGSNGSYSFEKIPADDYTIYVSKSGYVSDSKTITVVASKTAQGDFSLNKDLPVATPNSLTLTNDSYSASIELKNTRSGEMNYTIETSKAWLLANPVSGTIASMNSRIIKVTVDLDKVNFGEYNEKLIINVGEASLSIPVQFIYSRPNFIEIEKPEKDETYKMGETMPIVWTSNIDGSVKIDLMRYSSVVQTVAVSLKNENGGTHNWTIPAMDAAAYQIRISSDDYDGVYAISETFNVVEGPTVPVVSTGNVISLSTESLEIAGTVKDLGKTFDKVSQYGHVYSDISPNPTISDYHTSFGELTEPISFESKITPLTAGKTYYVRAYATNEKGTGYGETMSVTVPADLPVVTTAQIVSVTQNSAVSGGTVVSDGGNSILERGLCWGTSPGVNADANVIKDPEAKIGSFTSKIEGLVSGEKYYIRAYAKNSSGIGYGDELSFSTLAGAATVTTVSITDISSSSAKVSGMILGNGGGSIASYGFCYSTSHSPTTGNNKVVCGTSDHIGSFSGTIDGLSVSTVYYVRAYAVNEAGTAYGEELSLTTGGLAKVNTNSVTVKSPNSVEATGSVIDNGGELLTSYGFCYAINTATPTVDNNKVTVGTSVTGDFSSVISNLQPSTAYYFRAFATNKAGTAYGDVVSVNMPEGIYVHITSPSQDQSVARGEYLNIEWETNATVGNAFIELWKAGAFLTTLTNNVGLAEGKLNWQVPASFTAASDYQIKIFDSSTLELLAESSFFAVAGELKFTGPVKYGIVGNTEINWTCNYSTTLKFELYQGSQSIGEIASGIDASVGHYGWNPEMSGKEYRIKMTDENNPAISYISEPIEVLTPESACVDDRDGKIYKVVKIGDAYWFADNLEYDNPEYSDGIYSTKEGNAWDYDYYPPTPCPLGWHVPEKEEWYNMFISIGMPDSYKNATGYIESGNIGKKLKSVEGWPNGCGGENSFEFNAKYGKSSWWVNYYVHNTAVYTLYRYCYIIISEKEGVYIHNYNEDYEIDKINELRFNVRCVKD